ncbi:MAG: tetratricopeptide repeat protein [Stagnimonas sp.]|nr:tetratricopeptide repeat protein [Stagnimonas sp.]
MSKRLSCLLGLLALAGCATDPVAPTPTVPPPQSAIAYRYDSSPVAGRYESQAAPLSAPIRAPGTVLPGQGVYGSPDAGLQGMAEGNTGQAELDFEKALEVNPFDPLALNNLAVAKAEQGQFHEATAMLERAAKLQPDNAEIAANLARLRGYVQGYAMAGVSPAAQNSMSGPLPPAPPALWGTSAGYGSTLLPASEATVMPSADSGYYLSEACKRKTSGSGKNARVDIECEPQR